MGDDTSTSDEVSEVSDATIDAADEVSEVSTKEAEVSKSASSHNAEPSFTDAEIWATYVLDRKERYFDNFQKGIGPEYNSNQSWWNSLAEREWMVIEERMKYGIGVDAQIRAQLGEDFFERQLAEEDLILVDTEFEQIEVLNHGVLKIFTIHDFIMLSNQGIFREEKFLIDKQRKWEKKTIKEVESYGYEHIGYWPTNEITYIIFEELE